MMISERAQLENYKATSGTFAPVWTLEIQTVIEDVDKILDAVMEVHPLSYGRYQRNASVSAIGMETARPEAGSTTDKHIDGYVPGSTETYPMVELKISIERDNAVLEKVMAAVLYVHHYEEPVIFVREEAGQLYSDIAVAISASILISMIVAITVIPAACSRFLRPPRTTRARTASLAWLGQNPKAEVSSVVLLCVDIWCRKHEPRWWRWLFKRAIFLCSLAVVKMVGYLPAIRPGVGSAASERSASRSWSLLVESKESKPAMAGSTRAMSVAWWANSPPTSRLEANATMPYRDTRP